MAQRGARVAQQGKNYKKKRPTRLPAPLIRSTMNTTLLHWRAHAAAFFTRIVDLPPLERSNALGRWVLHGDNDEELYTAMQGMMGGAPPAAAAPAPEPQLPLPRARLAFEEWAQQPPHDGFSQRSLDDDEEEMSPLFGEAQPKVEIDLTGEETDAEEPPVASTSAAPAKGKNKATLVQQPPLPPPAGRTPVVRRTSTAETRRRDAAANAKAAAQRRKQARGMDMHEKLRTEPDRVKRERLRQKMIEEGYLPRPLTDLSLSACTAHDSSATYKE